MGAIERISQLSGQIVGASGKEKLLQKNPDDVVVTAALRTPFTQGGKGGFKDTQAADLMAGALKALLERSKIDPALVEDIAVGTVLAPGGGATEMRAAALVAGFPTTTAVRTLNRQCSSGLQASIDIINQIKSGMIEIGIGAGVESMSTQYGPSAVSEFSELLENNKEAANCKVPMGVLSEDMARDLHRLGQTILGKYVAGAIVGVPPLLMGQGPYKAIPRANELAGIAAEDVDIYEINEAFASQCLWSAEKLGIPLDKVNPKGGAIAFGHPLGCTGARQISTLLYELKRTGKKIGNTSMCIGTGMGMSAVWVAE
ncbi:E3 ubiquitin-protein ligase RBX1 [Verticillium dahliae VDG1]|nr:E3 ubiquitin-protein ligase RBX1 [Verticillium dahliae VDG1]